MRNGLRMLHPVSLNYRVFGGLKCCVLLLLELLSLHACFLDMKNNAPAVLQTALVVDDEVSGVIALTLAW